ncbi:hypothetical protein KaCgl_25850 [Corynebacterium glutamicum]|nr:hypothetical protein KaCgl_25850 [Corynebacterium glutamicum]
MQQNFKPQTPAFMWAILQTGTGKPPAIFSQKKAWRPTPWGEARHPLAEQLLRSNPTANLDGDK